MRTVVVYFILIQNLFVTGSFTYKDHIRDKFEATFHQKCDKYPFVRQFVNKLENTDSRYLTFVYQQPGLKNGGLGDRLGGLLSAVAMSIRFNRTLLIRSENQMYRLFRPYHPTDIHSPTPKYNWENWTSWSNYEAKYENNDDTEYDLWDCINNPGSKNQHCAMTNGDVSQQHILYRSNRCYLCHYDNQIGSVGNEQMTKVLGVTKSSDLYEVGGCMLRLALWPTDYLWDEVDKIYQTFEDSMPFRTVVDTRAATQSNGGRKSKRRLRQQKETATSTATITDSTTASGSTDRHLEMSTQSANNVEELGRRTNAEPFFQVGMHFRCGDKSFMHREGNMCIVSPENNDFNVGSPVDIGRCAKEVLTNYTASLTLHRNQPGEGGKVPDRKEPSRSKDRESGFPSHSHHHSNLSALYDSENDARHLQAESEVKASSVMPLTKFEMVFITSDNVGSAQQMNTTVGHPYTFISPQGCHIEMDASVACHLFTVSYWFMLAMSDSLVTQTLSNNGGRSQGPTSSFSRYAGIYGLKSDVFKDSRHCQDYLTNFELSRIQQSNWFCYN